MNNWRPDPLAPPPRRVSQPVNPQGHRTPVQCQCQGRTMCPCAPCRNTATQEDLLCDRCRPVPVRARSDRAGYLTTGVRAWHCH